MVFSACIYLRSRHFFFRERMILPWWRVKSILPIHSMRVASGGLARHFEEHVTSIYRKVSKQTELQQGSLTRNK